MSLLRLWRKMYSIRRCAVYARHLNVYQEGSSLLDNLKIDFKTMAYCTTRQNERVSNVELNNTGFRNKPRSNRSDRNNNSSRNIERAFIILNSSIQKSNRIYKTDLEKILLDIKTEGKSKDNYAVLLLQCCGDLLPDESPSARIDLAHKIWKDLQEIGIKFTVEHYNALLSCYAENGHSVSPTKFIADMHDEPNETTYHLLLACICEVGDIETATEIVLLMKTKGYPASEVIFNALVLGYARSGDMTSALGLLDLMNKSKIAPTSATYTALLQGFAEVGDKEKLFETYKEAAVKGAALIPKQIMKVVRSLAVCGHPDTITDVLAWLPELNEEASAAVKHMAIHLLHLGHEEAAYDVLNALLTTYKTDVSSSFGVFFIQEMIKLSMPVSKIVLLTDSLVSDGKNSQALERAVGVALSLGKVDTAFSLFDALKHRSKSIRPHYFWPLFIAASKSDGEKGVFEILRHMQDMEVTPDFDTLLDYVLKNINLADPQVVIRKLQDCGLTVSMILSPLLAELLNTGNIASAIELCGEYKGHLESDKLVQPLFFSYVTTRQVEFTVKMLQLLKDRTTQISDLVGQLIFDAIVFRRIKTDPDQLHELLKAIKEAGLSISSFVADSIYHYLRYKLAPEKMDEMRALIDTLVNADLIMAPSENLSLHIPHPREMSLEDLECHLIELRTKDLNKRGVLRRLIQEYCRQGKVEEALEAKQEFQAAGYEFSAGMTAMLFDSMVHVSNVDAAEESLKELNQIAPKFVLDEHKVIDFATLLISKNRDEAALTALKQRAALHLVKGGSPVARNCWRLLNAVAEKRDPVQTRRMLETLVQLGYCSVNNVLLGPVVRTHLNKNDLEGAVEEFQRCTVEHRATPLQHELLCQLVVNAEKSTQEANKDSSDRATHLVQQVMKFGSRVHGTTSMNVTLAVALAEMGLTRQLRRFLMGLRGRLNTKLLIERCKRLADEDKLNALEIIMKASRGITGMDLHPIYILMLKIYSRRGDCSGALTLWTSIQDLDIEPSPQFLRVLAALLRSHKREVPFFVPSSPSR